ILPDGLRKESGRLSIKGTGGSLGDERTRYGVEDSEVNPVEIEANSNLSDELIGCSIVFERQASQNWSAPEAEAIFTECVRSHWKHYAAAHQMKGGANG